MVLRVQRENYGCPNMQTQAFCEKLTKETTIFRAVITSHDFCYKIFWI